jgi:hypothetical protein
MLMLTVRDAARVLLISESRLRLLLQQGRLKGHKDPVTGRWSVNYPIDLTQGKRGPATRYRPAPDVAKKF